ncbi:hypothetical protein BJ875DRAFT_16579 [Amylocarpus encephaloides]|uniref:Uncharacterized protein n=1 Tax=Amylocarpus encephaloides TaxID=45428 RepID=A0A9P8C6S5_9HELO|nr:hypothetical protein BJ875DRAFT_16579 [Amylocarpus encephaloides]
MGFSLEGIIDKVGQQIDKKSQNNKTQTHQHSPGGYGRLQNDNHPPPPPSSPPPEYSEHARPHPPHPQQPDHHTGIGLLGMGAPQRSRAQSNSKRPHSPITHPNYTGPERKGRVEDAYQDPAAQYYKLPTGANQGPFTGGGLLGKMMGGRGGEGLTEGQRRGLGFSPEARGGFGRGGNRREGSGQHREHSGGHHRSPSGHHSPPHGPPPHGHQRGHSRHRSGSDGPERPHEHRGYEGLLAPGPHDGGRRRSHSQGYRGDAGREGGREGGRENPFGDHARF